MLELDVIADRLIGSDEDGGLSLEQRKRTTLGVELAANPSLVFLNEPTSGLDARSAQVCRRVSRGYALFIIFVEVSCYFEDFVEAPICKLWVVR